MQANVVINGSTLTAVVNINPTGGVNVTNLPQSIPVNLTIGRNTIVHTLGRQARFMQAFNSSNIPLGLDWTAWDDVALAYSTSNIYVYANEVINGVTINIF
jgi:hypothetical protein